MALVRRYFTFTPYPNPGDNGRTMTFPWIFIQAMYGPSVILPEEAKTMPFSSSSIGDSRRICYAESNDTNTTMMNDGSSGLVIDCMILEGGGNFNFIALSNGSLGTGVAMADHFSPAKVINNFDGTVTTYAAVAWNSITGKVEQTITTV